MSQKRRRNASKRPRPGGVAAHTARDGSAGVGTAAANSPERSPDEPGPNATAAQLRRELSALKDERAALEKRCAELEDEQSQYANIRWRLNEALKRNAELSRKLAEVESSTSWRLTAPLRAAIRTFRSPAEIKRNLRNFALACTRVSLRAYGALPLGEKARESIRRLVLKVAPNRYRQTLDAVGAKPGALSAHEQPDDPIWLYDIVDEPRFRIGFWRLTRDLLQHAAQHGRCSHVIALPFFATGGAEATAANYASAIVRRTGSSAVIVAVDRTLDGVNRFSPPPGVLMVDLSDYFPGADLNAREALLFGMLRLLGPDVFHIINSEAAWRLLIKVPQRIRRVSKVFGSIFAFQFDWKTGERVGYAETFLRDALPHLDGLLSDNQRFVNDAVAVYDLDGAGADRMTAIYNPVREQTAQERQDIETRLGGLSRSIETNPRLQVLWAGRLDAEKRSDLLIQVAQACPDMDFHVHGTRVVDNVMGTALSSQKNVIMYGAFTSPADVMAHHSYHAYMFTSRWEGMPNVVLEFGSQGLPVIAATVGGLVDLIDETTGYPLPERATAEDYIAALNELRSNPEEAVRRARALILRISERHNKETFEASLAAVPGYLGKDEDA
ncbi:MAG: glycosyltransferase [Hyphomonadaceae bacterium]